MKIDLDKLSTLPIMDWMEGIKMQKYKKISQKTIDKILKGHALYLKSGCSRGKRADFSGRILKDLKFVDLDLKWAYFRGAEITNCNFDNTNLEATNFDDAGIIKSVFNEVSLIGISLVGVTCFDSEFRRAIFKGASLDSCLFRSCLFDNSEMHDCIISDTKFLSSNMDESSFKGSELNNVDFDDSTLREFNFEGVSEFGNINLANTNLSGAKGLLNPIDYMNDTFEKEERGYIVYKTVGALYFAPKVWKVEEGSTIEEYPNYDRTVNCGCGINVATEEWVRRKFSHSNTMWKCLIKWEWLPGVVVPIQTDGKIRCSRLMLLEEVAV